MPTVTITGQVALLRSSKAKSTLKMIFAALGPQLSSTELLGKVSKNF